MIHIFWQYSASEQGTNSTYDYSMPGFCDHNFAGIYKKAK